MGVVGSYPQQSPVDDSDKVLIQDGVSDETKYAEVGDIAEQALNHITVTTDGNGWTIYDYGTHKVYKKRVTFSVTKVTGEYSQVTTTSLPVGMTTIGSNFVSASMVCGFADDTLHGLKFSSTGATSLPYSIQARANATFAGWVDYEIRTS